MHAEENPMEEEFRPRLIIWALGETAKTNSNGASPLSTTECLLILDSIAKLARPIIVFTGEDLLSRHDLHDIVVYGNALGLKMIIESDARHLTEEVLRRFHQLGPRIFRIMIDGAVVEDMDTRFRQSPDHDALVRTIDRLRRSGYEVHLGTKVQKPDVRALSFALDFAVRRAVKGLYCQLDFSALPATRPGDDTEQTGPDEYIGTMANLKRFLPKNMYFSPQCVRYGIQPHSDTPEDGENGRDADFGSQWTHWCLAGKTFVFISHVGKIEVCAGLPVECADLRSNGFDFVTPWRESKILRRLREQTLSCNETQLLFKSNGKHSSPHHHNENTKEIQDGENPNTA